MVLRGEVTQGLVKKNASLEQMFSGLPVDLLFVQIATKYENELVPHLRSSGVNVQNIAQVLADLYPVVADSTQGLLPESEIYKGFKGFRVGYCDAGDYYFKGNQPDKDHALILIYEGMRYGRMHEQLCAVLENYMGRKIGISGSPLTFAFIKNIRHENGWLIEPNAFLRVGPKPSYRVF